jgi:hypothetical protein
MQPDLASASGGRWSVGGIPHQPRAARARVLLSSVRRSGVRLSDASAKARVASLQGAYFLTTGIWPLVSRRTFEQVTGPKVDFWLAQTVGVLVANIGAALLLGARHNRVGTPLEVLGASSAAGLGAIDVIFSLRGRIAKTYVLDAAVEALILAGWIRARSSA